MKVLLVDDDDRIIVALQELLSIAFPFAAIATASSATDAITRLRESSFDLVISDVVMESPSAGWYLARAARARGVRTLLMSADDQAPWMMLERGVALIRKHELSARSIASFVNCLLLGDPP